MDVIDAIKNRRSVRAFLDKPVSNQTILDIFEIARFAPSGVNHQPWQAAVLSPAVRQKLSQAIISARESGMPENPDYEYYPHEWVDPFKGRRKACGLALYGALNIKYEEKEKRKQQWYKNYNFFGAPIGIIFYLDKRLAKGSWMDMGSFLQNIMLASRAFGLETCPQAALAEYPNIVRNIVGISDKFHIVCGMALGYPDWNDPVNNYRTPREDVSSFVHWI